MKINFVVNDYMTIWSLLYGPSISSYIDNLKSSFSRNYMQEFIKCKKDKDEILSDYKNFIPDDNTLYDIFSDDKIFDAINKDIEKYRIYLVKSWDKYKSKISFELKKIFKFDVKDFNCILLHPNINSKIYLNDVNTIAWGCKSDLNDVLLAFLSMIEASLLGVNPYVDEIDKRIYESIIHMAIVNEVYTNIIKSNYNVNSKYGTLERALYPYFLMYMGCDIEDTTSYMMRDNIAFDISKYVVNDDFKDMDILEFIDYLVKNKKSIKI